MKQKWQNGTIVEAGKYHTRIHCILLSKNKCVGTDDIQFYCFVQYVNRSRKKI